MYGGLSNAPGARHTRLVCESVAFNQQDWPVSAAAKDAKLIWATRTLQAESLSPQGSKQPVLSPSAMAADKHAQRSRQPPPAVTHRADSAGRKAPPLAPAPAPPLPEAEAARLGVPVALARSLMQACLPIQAAVQPQQASPPPPPGTIR